MTEHPSAQLGRLSKPPLPQTHNRSLTMADPNPEPNEYNEHSAKYIDPEPTQFPVESSLTSPQQLLLFFSQYHPESQFNMSHLNQSQKTKLKRYRGCNYFGEVVNEKRQGQGVMVYHSGRVYEGCWEGDIKHGLGFQRFANGSNYTGNFVNGKPEGFGTFRWANGEVYEGMWVNGQKHGSGMWTGGRGDSYVGEWKFGVADGYGVHTWINGDRYEGEFKTCLKHGEGVENFANGDKYSGGYINGKPSGYGEYSWSNGSNFKGYFKNGLRHGKGIWKKVQGQADTYEGDYVNDKKCGYGVFTWVGGNVYKGNYFEDLRHGYGEMYWADGTSYKGQWVKGVQHGEGEVVENGNLKKAQFRQNVAIVDEKKQPQTKVTDNPEISITAEIKSFRTRLSTSGNKNRTLVYSQEKVENLKPIPEKKLKPPIPLKKKLKGNDSTITSQITFQPKSLQKVKVSIRRGSLERNTRLVDRSPCARCAMKHSKDRCSNQKDPNQPQYFVRSSRLVSRTTNNNSSKQISNLNISTTSKLSGLNHKRLNMLQTAQTQTDSLRKLQSYPSRDDQN